MDCFCRLLSEENQDRLVRERGACIVYTHFARGFVENGVVRADFRAHMEQLSRRNGWFVPVGTLLGWLQSQRGGVHELTPGERRCLEWRWLRDKLFLGRT